LKPALRHDLEGDPCAPSSAHGCGSEDVPRRVDGHTAVRHTSIQRTGEGVEYALGPVPTSRGRELENCPLPERAAPRRTVEIACRVESQRTVGRGCIIAALKRVENRLGPSPVRLRRQHENRAQTGRATARSRAIDVPDCIQHNPGEGIRAIRALTALERVQHGLRPTLAALIGCQDVGGTQAAGTAHASNAIDVAVGVEGQHALGIGAVVSICFSKGIENAVLKDRKLSQGEDSATAGEEAMRAGDASPFGHDKEMASAVKGDRANQDAAAAEQAVDTVTNPQTEKNGQRPGAMSVGSQPEDIAPVAGSAIYCAAGCPVEVAKAIEDDRRGRISSFPAVISHKGVQELAIPGSELDPCLDLVSRATQ
jgi:hypothetical protein